MLEPSEGVQAGLQVSCIACTASWVRYNASPLPRLSRSLLCPSLPPFLCLPAWSLKSHAPASCWVACSRTSAPSSALAPTLLYICPTSHARSVSASLIVCPPPPTAASGVRVSVPCSRKCASVSPHTRRNTWPCWVSLSGCRNSFLFWCVCLPGWGNACGSGSTQRTHDTLCSAMRAFWAR